MCKVQTYKLRKKTILSDPDLCFHPEIGSILPGVMRLGNTKQVVANALGVEPGLLYCFHSISVDINSN